jgi:hypothetical protein
MTLLDNRTAFNLLEVTFKLLIVAVFMIVNVRIVSAESIGTFTIHLELSFMLRPTVSRSVCLGIKYPFGAYEGLSFIYAAGLYQRNLSLVRIP